MEQEIYRREKKKELEDLRKWLVKYEKDRTYLECCFNRKVCESKLDELIELVTKKIVQREVFLKEHGEEDNDDGEKACKRAKRRARRSRRRK